MTALRRGGAEPLRKVATGSCAMRSTCSNPSSSSRAAWREKEWNSRPRSGPAAAVRRERATAAAARNHACSARRRCWRGPAGAEWRRCRAAPPNEVREDRAPFVVGVTASLVPGEELSVARDIGPVMMAVGREMGAAGDRAVVAEMRREIEDGHEIAPGASPACQAKPSLRAIPAGSAGSFERGIR